MGDGSRTPAGQGRSGTLRRLLPLAVIAGLTGFVFAMGWHDYLTLENLAHNREALRAFVDTNYALALAAYAVLYIVAIALSLPGGALLTVSGGLLFGWLVGGLVTVVSATIGASVVFLIARSALGEPLAARAGPRLNRLREGFQEDALNYLLFLRLVPAFPFWLVNLAPALLGVPLGTFVVGTFLGIIPGTFAFAFFGAGLDSVIDAQIAANEACLARGGECEFAIEASALLTTELLVAFAALGIVAIIPVVLKKLRARPR